MAYSSSSSTPLHLAIIFTLVSLASAEGISEKGISHANCTTDLPGFRNHGDCNLLCKQTAWTDVAIFYLGNYVAHAATIASFPGQSPIESILFIALALLLPSGGLCVAMERIATLAIFAPTSLQTAARAGALRMVIRDESVLKSMDLDRLAYKEKYKISARRTRKHMRYTLPDGYRTEEVPAVATFEDDPVPNRTGFWKAVSDSLKKPFKRSVVTEINVPAEYNMIKILISLVQALYAIATLYRTKGDQIDRFGFAAFGLTVTPYAWMSIINLVANLCCPNYICVYLVETSDLTALRARIEAEGRSDDFPIGASVGKLTIASEAECLEIIRAEKNLDPTWKPYISYFLALIPFAVYGALSGFRKANSTLKQRIFTMAWLATGTLMEPAMDFFNAVEDTAYIGSLVAFIVLFLGLGTFAVAIGGYVVVGQMLYSYGVCRRIG